MNLPVVVLPPAHHHSYAKRPPSTPASSFVCLPPYSHTELAYAGAWMRPHDCCNGKFYCAIMIIYAKDGVQILRHCIDSSLSCQDGSSDGMTSVSDEIKYSNYTITLKLLFPFLPLINLNFSK
jgi:hypothetical protein